MNKLSTVYKQNVDKLRKLKTFFNLFIVLIDLTFICFSHKIEKICL